MMRKLLCILLSVVLLISFAVPAFATEVKNEEVIRPNVTESEVSVQYERIAAALAEANIDFVIEDNQLRLLDTSYSNVEYANSVTRVSFYGDETDGSPARTTYPTEWVWNGRFDHVVDSKLHKAAKDALAATLATLIGEQVVHMPFSGVKALAATFVTSYLLSLYEQKDEVTVYHCYSYYWREFGPGWFDSAGNFYSDIENKEVVRVTTNSDYTGGEVTETIQQDTIILPQ